MFNMDFKWGFLVAFFLYFAVDLALAVKSALGINIRLKVHPRIEQLLGMFNMDFKWGFLVAFFLYFAVDLALAVKSALGINIRLKVLTEIREELQEKYEEWSANAKLDFAQLEEKLLSSDIKDELLEKLHGKQREVGFFERRLMKSFPDMVNRSYPERLEELKNILKKKKLENKK